MESSTSVWTPNEGDTVRVKGVGLLGTVIKAKGVYERRFRLKVSPPALGNDPAAQKRARAAATRASRWYGLDELEQAS